MTLEQSDGLCVVTLTKTGERFFVLTNDGV